MRVRRQRIDYGGRERLSAISPRLQQAAVWDGGDAQAAQARLSAARTVLDLFPLQPATKAALVEVAGLPATAVRPPQIELTLEQRAQLRAALKELS